MKYPNGTFDGISFSDYRKINKILREPEIELMDHLPLEEIVDYSEDIENDDYFEDNITEENILETIEESNIEEYKKDIVKAFYGIGQENVNMAKLARTKGISRQAVQHHIQNIPYELRNLQCWKKYKVSDYYFTHEDWVGAIPKIEEIQEELFGKVSIQKEPENIKETKEKIRKLKKYLKRLEKQEDKLMEELYKVDSDLWWEERRKRS